VEGAGSHVKLQMRAEEAGDFLVGTSFAPEFADEFAMRLEFRAERLAGQFFKEAADILFHVRIRGCIRGNSNGIRYSFEEI